MPGAPIEVDARRRGVDRLTYFRGVMAVCHDCEARFGSTGPAWSHAASRRHVVEVAYETRFSFVPRREVEP